MPNLRIVKQQCQWPWLLLSLERVPLVIYKNQEWSLYFYKSKSYGQSLSCVQKSKVKVTDSKIKVKVSDLATLLSKKWVSLDENIPNMKSLSLIVQKLWSELFTEIKVNVTVINSLISIHFCLQNRLCYWRIHNKYEVHIFNSSTTMANLKVVHRQTETRWTQYAPDHLIWGHYI